MADRPLTFDPNFKKLGREVARFANHQQRLLRATYKHRSVLEEAAAWSEGTAPLDRRPDNPATAMRAIDKFARGRREDRATLVGAYFAHHHLRYQAVLSRELLRASFNTDPGHRARTCHQMYEEAETERRIWISLLLELVVSASAPSLSNEDYAAFNVGSLTDYEDVDLAIVVATVEARTALARSFAKVSKTFVRFASKIQLFLTEQLAIPRTGALIEEYTQILAKPAQHVVSATQLLGAQFLCGSPRLSRALEENITVRYYAGQGSPIVHEAYLRSVMNELRHYLLPATVPGVLAPKREIYVPSKLAVAAARVIHGVHEARPPHALALLADKDRDHREVYQTLADAFVQNEILRALMFLYVVPGDDLDLSDDTVRRCSRRVAVLLGLGESARRSAEIRLIGAYADMRAQALKSVAALSLMIARHLGRVSTLRQLLESSQDIPMENLALELLETLENYKGSVFWDEVVDLIGGNRQTGHRFASDLSALRDGEREQLAIRYVELMCEDAASLVELLVFIATEDETHALSDLFWGSMMRVLSSNEKQLERFIERLDAETKSEALFRLANVYSAPALAGLADLIEGSSDAQRSARVARAIRSTLILVHHSSNALGRLTARVLGRTPEFLQRLGDARRLKELSNEILTQAAREPNPREQIELLGDAFDVAAVRLALVAVLEGAPAARDTDFTQAVDLYVRELFKACFQEVYQRSQVFERYRPGSGIAIYATGGYGRSEAFGADWDYIAVVDRDDGALKKFFGKVLQRVSAAMARRGLPPHNRFTAHFNSYVVSISELDAYFQTRTEETFIDEAEVLEARFFLGDPAVSRHFAERIWGRVAKANGRFFVRDLIGELEDRRKRPPRGLNIKLSPGGLREIHLLWLAIRVQAELPGPLVPGLLPLAEKAFPKHKSDLRFLMAANEELRRARDLYRLVVAIDDEMDPDLLVAVARDLSPLKTAGIREGLGAKIERLMSRVALRIDRVVATIEDSLNT